MSGTIETPRGLDTLDKDDLALLDAMRDEGPEPERIESTPEAAAEPPDEPLEIDDSEEAEPARPTRTTVPHAQFHAAREQAKTLKKQLETADAARIAAEQKYATETAVARERIDTLIALAQAPATAPTPTAPPAEDPLPDVTVDPIGHFQKLAERQAKDIDALRGMVRGTQEREQQAQRIQDLRNWGTAQELAFEAQEPAYREAMTYLRKNRHEELQDIGITDPAERERIINNDITQIALKSRSDNANFGERLFKSAVRRGFAKAAPPPPPVPPPAPVIPPLDSDVETRATRQQEARENAVTIGSLGAAPPARMSVEKILNMDDAQFAAVIEKMKDDPAALRNLMGN